MTILRCTPAPAAQGSAVEVLLDAIVDVNRSSSLARPHDPLSADELRDAIDQVRQFLRSDTPGQRGLERLYEILEHRKLDWRER